MTSLVQALNSSRFDGRNYPKILTNNLTNTITDAVETELEEYISPVIGLIGNGLVILVSLLNKEMRSVSNVLIMSLALIDLLFVAMTFPMAEIYSLSKNSEEWPFGDIGCRLFSYSYDVYAMVSIWTLVIMSFDRYMVIVHPLSNLIKYRSKKNTIIAVLTLWVVVLCVCMRSLFIYQVMDMSDKNETLFVCGIDENVTNKVVNIFYDLIVSYLLPCLIMVILYMMILRKILTKDNVSQTPVIKDSVKDVTRTVVTVVIVYVVCQLPSRLIVAFEVRIYVIKLYHS